MAGHLKRVKVGAVAGRVDQEDIRFLGIGDGWGFVYRGTFGTQTSQAEGEVAC